MGSTCNREVPARESRAASTDTFRRATVERRPSIHWASALPSQPIAQSKDRDKIPKAQDAKKRVSGVPAHRPTREPPPQSLLYEKWGPAELRANGTADGGLQALHGAGFQPLDPTAARRLLESAARSGSRLARAHCLAKGWGVRRDPLDAARVFRELAWEGLAWAQHWIGMRHLEGDSALFEKDAITAFMWFGFAAANGLDAAMWRLGLCYLADGEKRDAMRWINSASERGHSAAMCYVADTVRLTDKQRAAELYRQASERLCAEGTYKLSLCYASGIGVDRDMDKADDLLRRAAAAGHPQAESALKRRTGGGRSSVGGREDAAAKRGQRRKKSA